MKRFSTACMYVCITLLPTAVDAQTATDFETRLREYSAIYVNENIARYSDEKHGCKLGGDITIDTCNVVVNIKVGACNSNGTGGYGDADQTPNISDD
ncbi:hypothetical protein RZS08_29375, partial [Arthrospira platensis SPKY1]|nr:hypothetical protein [Arthrospira platensis SPKY1]